MKRMDGMNANAGLRNDHNYNNLGGLDAIAEVSDESRASTPQGTITITQHDQPFAMTGSY